jgi:hypothetical protein
MKNSSPYRKAPIKRTRDSFIDDKNSVENPRTDFGQARHREVRRDKDKVKSLGITLYDVDFAVKSYIDQTMQLKVEDNGEFIPVPTLYANSEKWASIQKNGYLKDKKGKTLVPLITFRRSAVNMKQELRRNKVATTNQLGYVMQQKYSKMAPYDKFSTLYGSKKPQEYYVTPIPDYVDVTYDFILWCEYQTQLNHVIENFVYYAGKSFGERNFFKFSTNIDSITMEDNNTTGQDRVVRATFQITVHAYLLPKDVAGEVTTKRVVSPNKISFVSEAFADINTAFAQNDRLYNSQNFKCLNRDEQEKLEDLQRRLNDFTDKSLNKSPDVYPTELD